MHNDRTCWFSCSLVASFFKQDLWTAATRLPVKMRIDGWGTQPHYWCCCRSCPAVLLHPYNLHIIMRKTHTNTHAYHDKHRRGRRARPAFLLLLACSLARSLHCCPTGSTPVPNHWLLSHRAHPASLLVSSPTHLCRGLRCRPVGGEFAVQLVAPGDGHKGVHREEVVVHGRDDEGVAGPDDARGRHGCGFVVAGLSVDGGGRG